MRLGILKISRKLLVFLSHYGGVTVYARRV